MRVEQNLSRMGVIGFISKYSSSSSSSSSGGGGGGSSDSSNRLGEGPCQPLSHDISDIALISSPIA